MDRGPSQLGRVGRIAVALAAAGAALPGRGEAQSLPSTADPSVEAATAPPVFGFESGFTFTVEVPGGTQPPPGIADFTFELNTLTVDGTTVYDEADLRPLYADLIGTEISLERFFEIANAIEQKYRDDGYVLTFAYVPPQETEDGSFRIEVVEGYVDKVTFKDTEPRIERRLKPQVGAILDSRPLRLSVLESTLLGFNDLPGVQVTAVLQPSGTNRAASELIVTGEIDKADALVLVDNRGSKFTGPVRLTASANLNALPLVGSRTTFGMTLAREPKELRSFNLGHRLPLGSTSRLLGSFAVSWSEPGDTLEPLDVKSSVVTFQLDHETDLIRSRRETLTLGIGYTYSDSNSEILGTTLTQDRIRSADLTLRYGTAGWLGGATNVVASVEHGLGWLVGVGDIDEARSRADAENDYLKGRVQVSHLQPLFQGVSLLVTGAAQVARDPLFAAGEFAVGGQSFGRAYDSGELIGDHGAAAALELRYDPGALTGLDRSTQFYLFGDYGAVWDWGASDSRRDLASAGGGLRINFKQDYRLTVEYAQALTLTPSKEYGFGEGRLFFGVSKRF